MHMVFYTGKMDAMGTGVVVHCGVGLEPMGIVVTFWGYGMPRAGVKKQNHGLDSDKNLLLLGSYLVYRMG
jgi:hypothetical protein